MVDDPKLDMNRYYYRPGTTEPELRPEFVEEEAAGAEEDEEAVTTKPKKPAAKKKVAVKK